MPMNKEMKKEFLSLGDASIDHYVFAAVGEGDKSSCCLQFSREISRSQIAILLLDLETCKINLLEMSRRIDTMEENEDV